MVLPVEYRPCTNCPLRRPMRVKIKMEKTSTTATRLSFGTVSTWTRNNRKNTMLGTYRRITASNDPGRYTENGMPATIAA